MWFFGGSLLNFTPHASHFGYKRCEIFEGVSKMDATWDCALGIVYGQLIGDALGVRYEFSKAKSMKRRVEEDLNDGGFLPILGGGYHGLEAGQVSDDSEMALCLARSMQACKTYDVYDAACSYTYWINSSPLCAGRTTRCALAYNEHAKEMPTNWRDVFAMSKKMAIYNEIQGKVLKNNVNSESNGALMRISPLAIRYFNVGHGYSDLRLSARMDTGITHVNESVKEATMTFVTALASLLNQRSVNDVYTEALWTSDKKILQLLKLAKKTNKVYYIGQYLTAETADGNCQGYFGIGLQNAFYQLLHAPSFYEGMIDTILLGGDTDTNAAIAGAMLGARFGSSNIPKEWINTVLNARPSDKSRDGRRKSMDLNFISVKNVELIAEELLGNTYS